MISGLPQKRTTLLNFEVRRNDTFFHIIEEISTLNSKGKKEVINLTGCTVQMHIKKKKTDKLPTLVIDTAINANGELELSKNHKAMRIDPGVYYHDIEIKDADGNHITHIEGIFKVTQDVTDYVDEIYQFLVNRFNIVWNFVTVPKHSFLITFKNIITFTAIPVWRIIEGFKTSVSFTRIEWKKFYFTTLFGIKVTIAVPYQFRYAFTANFGTSVRLDGDKRFTYLGIFGTKTIFLEVD